MSTSANVMRVPCGCKALLNEKDPRAEIWMKVFGKLEFPLQSPVQHLGQAEGEHPDKFLRGDWSALEPEEQQRLCQAMKDKFRVDDKIFRSQVQTLGYVPIKDVNIHVFICQKHTSMMVC